MVLRLVTPSFPVLSVVLLLTFFPLTSQAGTGNPWHSAKDVEQRLKGFGNSKRTTLASIGQSPSGTKLQMLTIHPVESADRPAVLVIGNMSGMAPLGTEAALKLVGEILNAEGSSAAESVRWHILPMANPDGATSFYGKVHHRGGLNGTPVDEDRDGSFGEDPSEDLNGDGLITTMLVPDPTGQWIISEEHPLLNVEAKTALGQRGLYRRETEGHDNDGDGLFNEDGPGGVNPGRNFPHRYEYWTNEGGRWAADQPETRAILEFAYSHPQIAMILVLDQVNNLLQMPEVEERGKDGKYPIDDRRAEDWNLKPGQSLTLAELKTVLTENYGMHNPTDSQVLRLLEEDPATKMDPTDQVWWSAISTQYQELLEESGRTGERLPSPKSSVGSVEEWGYYQFGVPTFALDFWGLPMVADEDSTKSDDESDDQSSPADEDEKTISDKQKALLQFTEQTAQNKELADWTGLLAWQKTKLPSGETVLIGGQAPYATTTPPAALVDSLLATPIQFLATLPSWLPMMRFGQVEFASRGADVHELTVWLNNDGPIPYPIGQGLRTSRVPPLVLTLEGAEILEGRERTAVEQLPAHGSRKVRWLVRAAVGDKINITAEAPSLGKITKQLTVATKEGK